MTEVRTRKKLIEVSLPLDAINKASAREKSIRHGHPSNLHRWWARRPLAVARAVIFAQMVDDPSAVPEEFSTEDDQAQERKRLHDLLEQLVLWENTTNETVLQHARDEIWRSWRRACADNKDHPSAAELFNPQKLPAFHDPFAGGGALPLEAQRLGLASYAGDLNPVAVLICKAMIEIPPKFAGQAPVNPESRKGRGSTAASWKGAAGLAEDVRYYGNWMRDEAEKRIGHLYPEVKVTPEVVAERPDLKPYLGQELTVIAWLWARTVKSPNPAYAEVDVPLVSTFMLSTKPGKEAYVKPVVDANGYRFTVRVGKPRDAAKTKGGTKLSRGANFECLMSDAPISPKYIYKEAQDGRMGNRLMAIVAEGKRGRVYLSPTDDAEAAARDAQQSWKPEVEMPDNPRWFSPPLYGLTTFGDLFTPRQLVALTTFSDMVQEARDLVERGAGGAGLTADDKPLRDGGTGASAYADAVAVYLGLMVSKTTDSNSSLCPWEPVAQCTRQVFGRQAVPMLWDFGEANPLHDSSGGLFTNIAVSLRAFGCFATSAVQGFAYQGDAATQTVSGGRVVSTDPPYYDNIGYADLSDFFYVWLRRCLSSVFPDLFSTLAVPKAEELVATPYRHGTREKAEAYFLDGMTQAMHRLASQGHPSVPVTIYYAFKQSENENDTGTASTGWETFLQAVLGAGFAITGTWPVRSEMTAALKSLTNSLASSIVLVCRQRATSATTATRGEFLQELSNAMREALPKIVMGEIAPVDLAQACIGPGMAVYSKYERVLRQDGKPVTVREALADINSAVWNYMWERANSFDPRTRFCLMFFNDAGFEDAEFDLATKYARTLGVGVNTVEDQHLLVAEKGKAWLLPMNAYPVGVPGPERAFGGSVWEACMRLCATLQEEGERATAALARELGEGVCARARELAVWLYTLADAHKRTDDALAFNALDASWPAIQQHIAGMDRGQQASFT